MLKKLQAVEDELSSTEVADEMLDDLRKRSKDMINRVTEAVGSVATVRGSFTSLLEHFCYPKMKASAISPEDFFDYFKQFSADVQASIAKLSKPKTTGKKIGAGADPLSALANAIRKGGPMMPKFNPGAVTLKSTTQTGSGGSEKKKPQQVDFRSMLKKPT